MNDRESASSSGFAPCFAACRISWSSTTSSRSRACALRGRDLDLDLGRLEVRGELLPGPRLVDVDAEEPRQCLVPLDVPAGPLVVGPSSARPGPSRAAAASCARPCQSPRMASITFAVWSPPPAPPPPPVPSPTVPEFDDPWPLPRHRLRCRRCRLRHYQCRRPALRRRPVAFTGPAGDQSDGRAFLPIADDRAGRRRPDGAVQWVRPSRSRSRSPEPVRA